MLLKGVHLENFISHKKSDIEFDYGINVVTGPNGAGKTSILDAISFGLFNSHSRGIKENLINRSADAAKVVVEFNEGGVDYAVEWTISRRKASSGILFRIKGGKKFVVARGGERIITSEIEKILDLDKELFENSIYMKQGEIERLVIESPAVRKKDIAKLLGIEDLEKAYQSMRDIIIDYQRIRDTINGELKRKPTIEDKLKTLKDELEKLEKSLESKKHELEIVNEKLSYLEAQVEELNRKKEEFRELNSKKNNLEKDIENFRKEIEEKEKELELAEIAFKKVESLKEAVEKLPKMKRYVELFRRLNENKNEENQESQKLEHVKSLMNKLVQNEKSYNSYVKKNEALRQKREERKKYEGAERELVRVEELLQEDSKKRDNLSNELSQKLEEYSRILEEKITPENVESILIAKKSEVEKLRDELEKRIIEIMHKIGSIKEKIDEIEFKLSKISEAEVCPICGRELTPEHRMRLQEEYSNAKRESQEKIAKLEDELKVKEAEKKKLEKRLKKLNYVNLEDIKRITDEIEELNKKILREKSEIKELKKKVENLEKIDEEIRKLESETKELEEAYQEFLVAKRELKNWPSREEIEANLKKLNKEIEDISKEMKDLEAELGYKPEKPEQELSELQNKKEEYDRNEFLAKKRNELQTQVQELKKTLASKELELKKVATIIETLAYDEELHKKKQSELETKKQEKSNVEKEIARLEGEVKRLDEEKNSYENELKQLLEKEQEKALVEEFLNKLERIRNAFHKDGLQKIIRVRARPLLEKVTRELLERFNFGFSDVQIDEDYNIFVVGPAGTQSIDQISGGERVALAIALRLAIARILSEKVETVIMDEPTIHLDEERRKELVNVLNSFFREGGRIIPQIIVITHHPEIEDVADMLYHVSKKGDFSVVEVAMS